MIEVAQGEFYCITDNLKVSKVFLDSVEEDLYSAFYILRNGRRTMVATEYFDDDEDRFVLKVCNNIYLQYMYGLEFE